MNRKFLVALAIPLILIGGVFLYARQSIKDLAVTLGKDKSELQTLVTDTWKIYASTQFGFRFRYPDYVSVCDVSQTYGPNLPVALGLYPQMGCTSAKYDIPSTHISIIPNVSESIEELFLHEYGTTATKTNTTPTPTTTSAELEVIARPSYVKIGNAVAYGGVIADKSELKRKNPPGQYRYVFFVKGGDRVFRMSVLFFNTGSSLEVNQSLFNAIANSLYFDPQIWK